mmetsp:Transcript_37258/g.96690  ORF Transcript_37258/g.96690 Transcript_37258/m.96690 type:complete len:205 (+) Transcript_37258:819-1433(+)
MPRSANANGILGRQVFEHPHQERKGMDVRLPFLVVEVVISGHARRPGKFIGFEAIHGYPVADLCSNQQREEAGGGFAQCILAVLLEKAAPLVPVVPLLIRGSGGDADAALGQLRPSSSQCLPLVVNRLGEVGGYHNSPRKRKLQKEVRIQSVVNHGVCGLKHNQRGVLMAPQSVEHPLPHLGVFLYVGSVHDVKCRAGSNILFV